MTVVRRTELLLAAAVALAIAAPLAAPSSDLLPAPDGVAGSVGAAALLFAAFLVGFRRPLESFYALVLLVVFEGAIRKWLVNDLTVFLLKDFLALGVYAAVLPRLSRDAWRRPWWLLAPLAALLGLALLSAPLAGSWREAFVGLRAYAIYVPLFWVAPALVTTRARAAWLLLAVVAIGAVECALALAQALAGPGVLNELVSGAQPAIVTIGDSNYIRPTGTFMHVGSFSGFLLFFMLAAFSLVVWARAGRLYWAAIGGSAFLAFGVVYSSARAVLGSLALAFVALAGALLWRRRIGSLLAVTAAFGAGMAAVFLVLPVTGLSGGGSGYLGRAADVRTAGDTSGRTLWADRIRPQLELIGDQRLVGNGPGTMTLGNPYVSEGAPLPGEGEYTKVAYELGLAGLALFVWLIGALVAATVAGALRTGGWQRACALIGAGAAAILPLWYAITFMLDVPVVGILFWSFAGLAVAAARPREAEAPA